MGRFLEETVKRQLRHYYNEIADIINDLDEEEITFLESEKALQQLDEKYAKIIVKELDKPKGMYGNLGNPS